MTTTTRATITHLAEGQRQKEVAVNTALDIIDAALWSDMGEYTVAGLPSASANPNAYALVTDTMGSPGVRTIVRSDGTNWKIVAAEGATIT